MCQSVCRAAAVGTGAHGASFRGIHIRENTYPRSQQLWLTWRARARTVTTRSPTATQTTRRRLPAASATTTMSEGPSSALRGCALRSLACTCAPNVPNLTSRWANSRGRLAPSEGHKAARHTRFTQRSTSAIGVVAYVPVSCACAAAGLKRRRALDAFREPDRGPGCRNQGTPSSTRRQAVGTVRSS